MSSWGNEMVVVMVVGACNHQLYILYIQRDATYTMFFIIISALHVPGGFSAHHQAFKPNSSNPTIPAVDSRRA